MRGIWKPSFRGIGPAETKKSARPPAGTTREAWHYYLRRSDAPMIPPQAILQRVSQPLAVLAEHIPDDLKQRAQWVCWRYVPVPDKEKPDKRPYHPSGYAASI